MACAFYEDAIVKTLMSTACIDDVFLGFCRWLKRVIHWRPRKGGSVSLFIQRDGKILDRQRLNHIVTFVEGGDIFDDSFINRTGKVELKVWIVGKTHVGKVLVGEHFENAGWWHRGTCLAIVSVPELSHLPVIFL